MNHIQELDAAKAKGQLIGVTISVHSADGVGTQFSLKK